MPKKVNNEFHDDMNKVVKNAYEEGRKIMERLRGSTDHVLQRSLVESTYFDLVKMARRFGHICPPFGRPQGIDAPPRPVQAAKPKPEPQDDPSRQVIADNADEDTKEEIKKHQKKRRKSSKKKTKK